MGARRITDSNRLRSIETEYDDENPTANCTASKNTKFLVRLYYKSKTSSPSEQNIILVQVQRRSGCSLIFNEEYKAIIQAAKYGHIVAPKKIVTGTSRMRSSRLSNILPDIPVEEGVLERSLDNAQSQLLSNGYDTRILGLEDVAATTNPQILSDDIALEASKIIMLNDKYSGIRESISTILFHEEKGDSFFEDGKYIRNLALTILLNVMDALSRQ